MRLSQTFTEDLTDVQVEKIQKLAETVDFESEEEYAEKLQVIKENYFLQTVQLLLKNQQMMIYNFEVLTEEEAKEVEETAEMSDTMKWYDSALSQNR